ncbi:hypothetical protein PG996_013335 [Apiospora saccharicola]|uniref:Uncharacterized protein n=1 Tax=Apiospora saccharicola TaxID=335842 RepID=A0ABR1U7Y6_9PEZI
MKLLSVLLALSTAVIAAPAAGFAADPPNFVMNSVACACANDQGRWRVDDLCHSNSGWPTFEYPDAWSRRNNNTTKANTNFFGLRPDEAEAFAAVSAFLRDVHRVVTERGLGSGWVLSEASGWGGFKIEGK